MFLQCIIALPEFIISCDQVKIDEVPETVCPHAENQINNFPDQSKISSNIVLYA